MKPKLVIDLRYTATFESNSANAARVATRILGAKSVLVYHGLHKVARQSQALGVYVHQADRAAL